MYTVTHELRRMIFAPEMGKRKEEPMSYITGENLPPLYCSINVSVLYTKRGIDKKLMAIRRERG